jgi:hypothetical protein
MALLFATIAFMHRKLLKKTGIMLLLAMPLIIVGLWSSWYKAAFDAWNSKSGNYTALAGLYGKADICKDKDSLLGRYALTCTSIYSFCNSDPPNIERDGDYAVDKTNDCRIYMSATKPFRYLFIPSIVLSLAAFGVGVFMTTKALRRFTTKRTKGW